MPMNEGMGRRKMKSGDEYDVHTGWRKLLQMKRGETARVKRRTRRRERAEAKRRLARGEE